ncbi:Polysaccharide biosynthesis protein [Flaviramulus basaltis]|uniref:Polysaccharide biosynthesis protein n=1 Tax=Flaviramulus basaltis TaxID=369401 RepID=A0A1K2IEG5_9FLAO|nr:polysaccharide biosynthesis protein [Flaviramulus basaltis]SFZ90107.1 Polysaccharide biosynthesis protein [Flaviramulus basaltis]
MVKHNIEIEDLIGQSSICTDCSNTSQLIEGKTIFVTGGAGSIGSEIVLQIGKYNPKKVVVIDQSETAIHNLSLIIEKEYNSLNFYPVVGDIRSKKTLKHLFKKFKPDIVYHCAAYKHVPIMENNPSEAVLVNIMGTKILADLSVKYKTERFVLISTDKAVNPSSVMGATKRIAEMYLQFLYNSSNKKDRTKFITTRFGNVLGSNGSVFFLFKKQIEEGGPITITHPDITRYFITIPEASQLVIEASSMGTNNETYIFNMGKAIKIIDFAKKMIHLSGFIPEKDIEIKLIGLRLGEKLFEELLNSKSTTSSTSHKKIMLVKENNDKFDYAEKEIDEIIEAAKEYKSNKIVKKIKKLVPEYKSLNSYY